MNADTKQLRIVLAIRHWAGRPPTEPATVQNMRTDERLLVGFLRVALANAHVERKYSIRLLSFWVDDPVVEIFGMAEIELEPGEVAAIYSLLSLLEKAGLTDCSAVFYFEIREEVWRCVHPKDPIEEESGKFTDRIANWLMLREANRP